MTSLAKISSRVFDSRPYGTTLSIRLTAAVADAWDDVASYPDRASLDAFGNPSLRVVRQACIFVAGMLAKLALLIPANTRQESHRDEDCPPPPPYSGISSEGFRRSVGFDSWPSLCIEIAPRHRKAWLKWISERLAEIGEVDWMCEHGVIADGAHPHSPLACSQCKPLDDEQRAEFGYAPREQPPAPFRVVRPA